jgi:Leu/Phe-tRNA-protein transferase
MKSGDIFAILHPEKFAEARSLHKVWRDELPKITVDTGFVVDVNCYETGIYDGCWHIVERYDDEQSAEVGHAKWLKWVNENPDAEIPDTLTEDY